MRIRARTDANQASIVKGLRGIGASVAILAQIGNGIPDLLVGFRGKNFLFEIKDGDKPPSQKKLTADEKIFFATWKGSAFVVENIEQAIKVLIKEI